MDPGTASASATFLYSCQFIFKISNSPVSRYPPGTLLSLANFMIRSLRAGYLLRGMLGNK